MWTFLAIVGIVIVIMLVYDNNNRVKEIDSNGGILIKYNTLLKYLLAAPNTEITGKGKDFVNVTCKGRGATTQFNIIAGFGKTIVKWELILGAMGSFKHTWEFSEDVSQDQMIIQINEDIKQKSSSVF